MALGNTLEALVDAGLLRHLVQFDYKLSFVLDLVCYLISLFRTRRS
jgi:hypothetical protein